MKKSIEFKPFLRVAFVKILILFSLLFSGCIGTKLCPIPGCQVRMLHQHQGVKYRGQPWWKWRKQNPRVGERYVMVKDRNLVEKERWWKKKKRKKKDDEENSKKIPGIKARDPSKKQKEEDKEDGFEEEGSFEKDEKEN